MRYCFLFCLLFVFGCKKSTDPIEDPKCRLASIIRADYEYPITYEGTRIVKVGKETGYGYGFHLYYDNVGRLTVIESQLQNPNYRTELYYNNEGKISMEKNYERNYSGNWQEHTVCFYTYTNGKLTAIREAVQWASPAFEYDHEVIWDGENIRTIIIRSGTTAICTQQYGYDITQKNPMTAFADLYYSDNFGSSFKMPLYVSANLLVKEETSCPSVQTNNLTYEFKDSLLQKVNVNGYSLIAYSYECR